MLDEIDLYIAKMNNPWVYDPDKYWTKANRWLGFIQGVLWGQGIFTIDQLKEDNRSE